MKHSNFLKVYVIELLAQHRINHYERELEIEPNVTVDIGWNAARMAIEVNGHANKLIDAWFSTDEGQRETRAAKQTAKLQKLAELGYTIFVFDFCRREEQEQKLLEFATQASSKEETFQEMNV